MLAANDTRQVSLNSQLNKKEKINLGLVIYKNRIKFDLKKIYKV
jgi:hypothetical protein